MINQENSPWLKFLGVELSRQARVTGNSGVRDHTRQTPPRRAGPTHGRVKAGRTGRPAGTPSNATGQPRWFIGPTCSL